ncbi:hypothetical protein GLOIN_2v1780252 [Rhizophagus irregularis DAOM 181602=DAOM 197198]|nr:hypothetical protein GLOIN_2v1780252 [Rhizophagus irregularis DAOM 181602=DAOM 197198]
MREKHQKVKSLLGDEDILQMITEYLRSVGYNVTVREFKAYIKQDEFRVEKKNVYYDEVDGRLKFEEEEACVNCVMMKPGTNRDGWWKTDGLIKQITEKEIHIFENYILPGGKGKFKDGIMPADGSVQPMHLPNGQPKVSN